MGVAATTHSMALEASAIPFFGYRVVAIRRAKPFAQRKAHRICGELVSMRKPRVPMEFRRSDEPLHKATWAVAHRLDFPSCGHALKLRIRNFPKVRISGRSNFNLPVEHRSRSYGLLNYSIDEPPKKALAFDKNSQTEFQKIRQSTCQMGIPKNDALCPNRYEHVNAFCRIMLNE